MAESNSKGEKTYEEEDRISNLPDNLLDYILSCLPTKTAVATGRLSRRWRHLRKHLSDLNFTDNSDESFFGHYERFRSFALLVNGVLEAFVRTPHAIQKFHLKCAHSYWKDNFRACSVEKWVRAAIDLHPKELDLNLYSYGKDYPSFKLPPSLFTSTNLVSLSLVSTIQVHLESSTPITLPSLKKLLISIHDAELPSVNILLCGCPNIESLDLRFSIQSMDKVCVPPSLTWLYIDIENEVGAYLEINAPNLEYLNITGITFDKVFHMYNLHNVVEAHLDVFPHSLGSVIPLNNLLNALSGIKHLVLGRSTTKWLLGKPRDLTFQELHHLLRLELTLNCFNSNSLLNLLHKCPMLQVLIIQNDKEQSSLLGSAPTPSVPNCLVSHLTSIQLEGFLGLPDEVTFVEHVLQNGLVLKTLTISDTSLDLSKKYDILKRLSNVPRASGMCQLTFD